MNTTAVKSPSAGAQTGVQSTGCCPRFNPIPWQDRELIMNDKLFLKERVHCVWHIPLDIGRAFKRASARIAAVGASPEQPLLLSDDVSPWHSDLYLEVTRDIPEGEVVRFSGTYLVHVYEGPFSDAPEWMRDMHVRVAARGKRAAKMYLGYTTCPKCAKAYGENYVLILAKVA